ncbi:MAG TPA: 3-oxoacyl-ACP synthase III family protein [Burkholderiaceae bacterium]
MTDTYLSGVAAYLPGEPIPVDRIATLFHLNAEWIAVNLGTSSVHLAFDFERRQATETLCSMAAAAGQRALRSAGIGPEDVDFVVLATATPDLLLPTTVNLAAERLGISGVPTFQLQCGCSGGLQAVQLAQALVRSGGHRRGLVLGGDISTKFLRSREECARLSAAELVNYALFGDGAGAAIVSASPLRNAWRLLHCGVVFEGIGREPGQQLRWLGIARPDDAPAEAVSEDYKAILRHVPAMTARALDHLFTTFGLGLADVRHYLLPQLSKHLSDRIRDRLGVPPERAVQCVEHIGNTGNAGPFAQLAAVDDRARADERLAIIAIESSKWLSASCLLQRMPDGAGS